MKKMIIFLLILIGVSVSAFATRKVLVAKRIRYQMSHEWDERGGNTPLNKRVMDSTYKHLVSSQSQFIKIDSVKWDSLKSTEALNKNYIFIDEIVIVDHYEYWEVSLIFSGESTKLPVNFKAYWDVDTYIISSFDKIREKIIEGKNIALEEEKVDTVTSKYAPKWSPKFIREQDKKKRHRN